MIPSTRSLLSMIFWVASIAAVAAQPATVTGTGDPYVDVPAVQAAVDQGGSVVLIGHFSFDRPPSAPPGAIYNRMVTVSKSVVISGRVDENGNLPTIRGGDWPFFVDAAGAQVTIQGLHFVRSKSGAIWIFAAGGATVIGCRVQGVIVTKELQTYAGQPHPSGNAVFVGTDPHPPNATHKGIPENLSGTFAIVNNHIDVGAEPDTQTLGVSAFNAGRSPDKEVTIWVSGNRITNVTEPAINFRAVGGRAYAEHNVIFTGGISLPGSDAVRVVGSGSYVIAHNRIDCGWTTPPGTGINVWSPAAPNTPEAGAVIADNDVFMSAPEGAVFTSSNGGIQIGGSSKDNLVLNNRVRGRSSAGLSVIRRSGGTPGNTSFIANDLSGMQSSVADILINTGATRTIVIGRQASIEDHGTGTALVPMR